MIKLTFFSFKEKEKTTYAREKGTEVVMLNVKKRAGQNMISAIEQFKEKIKLAKADYLPKDLKSNEVLIIMQSFNSFPKNNHKEASNNSMLFPRKLNHFQYHRSSITLLGRHNNKKDLQDFLELRQTNSDKNLNAEVLFPQLDKTLI